MWDEQVPQLVTLTNWAASSSLPPWEQKWKANRGEDVIIKVSKVRGKRKNLTKRKPGSWGKGIGGADDASEKNLKIVKIGISDNVYAAMLFYKMLSREQSESKESFWLFHHQRVSIVSGTTCELTANFLPPRYCVTLHCYLVPLCLASIRSQTKAFCVPGMTLFVEASLL